MESRIRKPVGELTLADFLDHPVWEFALDEEGEEGQDESTVRPYDSTDGLDPEGGSVLVRASFHLSDGTTALGYISTPVGDVLGLDTLQPVVVTDLGRVVFWCGSIAPDRAQIAAAYARLGKTSSDSVFPIHFDATIPMTGDRIAGTIAGFIVLTDCKSMTTRVEK